MSFLHILPVQMPATETLASAKEARASGDVDRCLVLASAAEFEASYEHDWDTACWSATARGIMYQQRREPHLAIAHFHHARDLALTHGLTRRLGGVYHDIALALLESGDVVGFKQQSAVAFTLYCDADPRSPGISGLIADMAQAKYDQDPSDRRDIAHAMEAWRAVPTSMTDARYQLVSAAQTMKAAAALGIRSKYDTASEHLDAYLRAVPSREYVAAILSEAARAALRMLDFERAADLAGEARQIASGRRETVLVDVAGEVLIAALAERTETAYCATARG